LCDRKQFVSIAGRNSSLRYLTHGVPQGSVLGPLLFCMYVIDLPSVLSHCKYHLYAGDFQISVSCRPQNLETTISKLNEDLQKISVWSSENRLVKSKCIRISSNQLAQYMQKDNLPAVCLNQTVIPYSTSQKPRCNPRRAPRMETTHQCNVQESILVPTLTHSRP